MIDIYDFYDRMERNNILLSFKGEVTSELLTSILQIMESKLQKLDEQPRTKKKVYSVLVECLQNLYHHMDDVPLVPHPGQEAGPEESRSAIFMIGREKEHYNILTGNYIFRSSVERLKERIDEVNEMDRDQLKAYYKEVLNNGHMSDKGGGGLGIIDIARKSGQKLVYNFMTIDDKHAFFTLNIKIAQNHN